MTRILVLGGSGEMGSVAVKDLIRTTDHEITIGDLRTLEAEKLLAALGAPVSVIRVDVSSAVETLAALFEDFDLILNATLMRYNVRITDAAIAAGTHLVDLGSYYVDTLEQLDRHEAAKNAGVRIVPGCGVAPGLTNVLAAYGASKLDEVQSIEMFSYITHPMYTSPGIVVTRFDASTGTSVVLEDGKVIERPSFGDAEKVTFAEPYGEQTVHLVPHPEIITLPRFIDVPNVKFKVGYTEDETRRIETLLSLGFDDDEPMEVAGHSISPRTFAAAHIGRRGLADDEVSANVKRVLVHGTAGGIPTTIVYDFAVEESGRFSASSTITGTVAAISARMVAEGGKPGVLPPEAGLDAADFLERLSARGLEVTETVYDYRLSVSEPAHA